jgi:hypothetical protein
MMQALKYFLGLILATMLSGCFTTIPVKEMTADKEEFLKKHFSSDTTPKDIPNNLSKDGSSPRFKKIRAKFDISHETTQGKKESPKQNLTFIDQGNGLIQEIDELSNNDIAYYLAYRNTYRGILILKTHGALLNQTIAGFPIEIKQMKTFTPLPSLLKQGEKCSEECLTSGNARSSVRPVGASRQINTTLSCKAPLPI